MRRKATTPRWATRRWRLLYRLFGAVPADEADGYAQEAHRWQHEVSNALDLTIQDHGIHHASLERAVKEIKWLRERVRTLRSAASQETPGQEARDGS